MTRMMAWRGVAMATLLLLMMIVTALVLLHKELSQQERGREIKTKKSFATVDGYLYDV